MNPLNNGLRNAKTDVTPGSSLRIGYCKNARFVLEEFADEIIRDSPRRRDLLNCEMLIQRQVRDLHVFQPF